MVAAALLAFAGWTFLAAGEVLSQKGLSSTLFFSVAVFGLGFWDDLAGLSPLTRFLFQCFFSVMFLLAWSGLFPKFAMGGRFVPQILWVLAGAFWVVWMVNLYNFMDGIDGLAGGEAAVASSFFFLLFAAHGESGWAVANLFVAAAAMGFLVHNWPPAKVFMGDAGSSFLGAFYGMQAVIAPLTTSVPFLVLVLPFSNFILDTTVTLFRRIFRGEKWYHAHRSHFYQRMTNLGMSHRRVSILELLSVAASCLAATFYIYSGFPARMFVLAAVCSAFIAGGLWVIRKERDAMGRIVPDRP